MKMKTLIATILLCIWGSTFAMMEKPLTVSEQIRRKVDFDEYALKHKMEGYVHVLYKIDELHRIEITSIEGSTSALVEYVKKQLDNQEVYGQELALNRVMTITFAHCASGKTQNVTSDKKGPLSHSR